MGDLLLYFWVLHVCDGVGRVPLPLFEVTRPHVVYPVDKIYLQTERTPCLKKQTKTKYNRCSRPSASMTSEHRPIRRCMVTYCGRSPDQVLQLGVTELQADDIIELPPLRRRRLEVTRPLGHGHLRPLLRADVHHIDHTSAAWQGRRVS